MTPEDVSILQQSEISNPSNGELTYIVKLFFNCGDDETADFALLRLVELKQSFLSTTFFKWRKQNRFFTLWIQSYREAELSTSEIMTLYQLLWHLRKIAYVPKPASIHD